MTSPSAVFLPLHSTAPYFLMTSQSPANSPALETWHPLAHFLPLFPSQFTTGDVSVLPAPPGGRSSPLLAAGPAPSSRLRVRLLGRLTLSDRLACVEETLRTPIGRRSRGRNWAVTQSQRGLSTPTASSALGRPSGTRAMASPLWMVVRLPGGEGWERYTVIT